MVENARPSYPISSADNVVRVLLMLQHAETLRVTTVANDLGVSHSTAHRLLAVLVHRGLIEHDERRRTYQRGAGLAALAAAILRNDDLVQRAKPTLDSLAEQLDETVHLTVLRSSRVMFVAVAEGSRAVRAADRTGTTLPAHRTAAGKAILASLSADALERWLRAVEPAVGDLDRGDLVRDLAAVRACGFAVNRGDTEPDLWAVAAPVIKAGVAVASITVGRPVSRADEKWVAEAGHAVTAAAQLLAESFVHFDVIEQKK
ncbi:MAG: IclR family transcriptional regulator [Ilumatobacteraceae bacterium]